MREHSTTAGRRLVAALLAASLLAALCSRALAADVPCPVGTRVFGEMAGGKVGEIAELGTESPHEGWVRITYSWSPGGEWYDWRSWAVHPEGSSDRCAPPAAAKRTPASDEAPPTFGIRANDDDDPPPAPAPVVDGGPLEPGSYSCSAEAAGTFPIEVIDGNRYRDRAGTVGEYAYDAATSRITWTSGSLAGQYGRKLKPGKFGLSSAPARTLYVVCNRR